MQLNFETHPETLLIPPADSHETIFPQIYSIGFQMCGLNNRMLLKVDNEMPTPI